MPFCFALVGPLRSTKALLHASARLAFDYLQVGHAAMPLAGAANLIAGACMAGAPIMEGV